MCQDRLSDLPTRILAVIGFRYIDRNGKHSKRVVEVVKYDFAYFYGYCRLARANRQFKFTRLQICMDMNTRRRIRNLYLHLGGYEGCAVLPEPIKSTPLGPVDFSIKSMLKR